MNEIEQKLADALADHLINMDITDGDYTWDDLKKYRDDMAMQVHAQFKIGKYYVEFAIIDNYADIPSKYVVDIDGYNFHKTKEQRRDDYEKERFLQSEEYRVIRFTSADVFSNADKCAEFVCSMMEKDREKIDNLIQAGEVIGALNAMGLTPTSRLTYLCRMYRWLTENTYVTRILAHLRNFPEQLSKEFLIKEALSTTDYSTGILIESAFESIDKVHKIIAPSENKVKK